MVSGVWVLCDFGDGGGDFCAFRVERRLVGAIYVHWENGCDSAKCLLSDRYINVTWGSILPTSKLFRSAFTRVSYASLTRRQFTYRNMDSKLDLPHSKKRKLSQQDNATPEAKVPKSRPSRFILRLALNGLLFPQFILFSPNPRKRSQKVPFSGSSLWGHRVLVCMGSTSNQRPLPRLRRLTWMELSSSQSQVPNLRAGSLLGNGGGLQYRPN